MKTSDDRVGGATSSESSGQGDPPPRFGWFGLLTAALLAVLLWPAFNALERNRSQVLVVYAAQDQDFAEPVFQQFTLETGIKVLPLYDSEAVKTVGLAKRLLAERPHPQCDVFWGNEELRTRQLAAQKVFRETNGWIHFGFRTRRVVINTNKVALASLPHPFKLSELTNAAWRGRVALAYPLFGSTSTHFLALRQKWGETNWGQWCRALQANRPFLVEGNSMVIRMVGRGEAWIGLTDWDDLVAGQKERLPIVGVPTTTETLLLRNTLGVIRNGPHPKPAEEFFNYLQRPETVHQLVAHSALEGLTPQALPHFEVDWDRVLDQLEPASAALQQVFLR